MTMRREGLELGASRHGIGRTGSAGELEQS